MSSSLRFITSNPTVDALAKGEDRYARRLHAESTGFAIDEARRRSAEEQAQDRAIRSAIPQPQPAPVAAAPAQPPAAVQTTPVPPNMAALPGEPGLSPAPAPAPSAPAAPATAGLPAKPVQPQQPMSTDARMAAALAKVPGGGRIAMGLAQNAERKRDQDETNVMHYLSNPQTAHVGMALAQKIGMQIPPQLAQNTAFWQGSSIAKQLYESDVAAAQRFTAAFAQSQQPDINAKVQEAMQAAGVPVKKKRYGVVTGEQGLVFYNLENPAETIQGPARAGTTMVNERGETVYAPAAGGEVTPFTQGGEPLRAQKFGSRAATNSVLVKIGSKTGNLYPADHNGAGADGEDVVALPAQQAAQIAVARGNQQSRERIAEIAGDTRVQAAQIYGDSRRDVATTAAQSRETAANIGAASRESVATTAANSREAVAQTNATSRESVAGTQAQSRETVAAGQNASRENVATTNADARLGAAQTAATARTSAAETAAGARTAQIGADARTAGGKNGTGRKSVYEQKREAWLAANPGDEKGALEYASGRRKLAPAEEERIASGIAKNEASQSMTPLGPDAVRKRTQEILAGWRKEAAAPSPAAATTAQASPRSYPYEAAMGDKPIYSQDGKKWVYEDGTPVQ